MKKILPKMLIGFLIGLICPFIIVYGIYFFKYPYYELVDYLITSFKTGLLAKTLALGAILNLGAFMLFINLKKELWARGILLATVVVGGLIVYIKFLA